ncbi:DUF6508 domain-containing protein [Paucilactobacillus wasatchensis]|uniref:Uncharacterized protein n=1 Tax=Paucilactobacillus wasatchensis TaxID=1335616 RepID=A0A0D1AAY7_9LACO|nr:DUF6508 domain-containing protein [Paucilactobacillus wasatchensis]KIS03891.1 hypothetical protein WDC_0538 [Paucilactobacillus wasatchensis]
MNLQDYVQYFKDMRNQEIAWTATDREDGILQMGYPKYDPLMLKFSQEFLDSSYCDPRYRKTLKQAHIKLKTNHMTVGQVMLTQDVKLIEAMLTQIIRSEPFDEGSWAKALQEGYFYRLTNALISLEGTTV